MTNNQRDDIRSRTLTGAIAALALIASTAAQAQPTPAEAWSYNDCVEYARLNNISLKQAELSEQSSAVSLESARAQWQPSLDFTTSQGVTNTPWTQNSSSTVYNSSYGLNAAWTLWDGGKRTADISRSAKEVERSKWATDQTFRDIRTEILTDYLNILYAREAIAVNEAMLEVSTAQAERARQMMESGKISIVDYQQLATQAESDRYNVVTSKAELATRRLALKNLLELDILSEIDVAGIDFDSTMVTASLPQLEESYRLTLLTDSRLRYDSLSVAMADDDIKAARAEGMPQIGINAGIGTSYYSSGTAGWGEQMKRAFNENLGLTLSVPILDRKKRHTAVAQARIARLNSELDVQSRRVTLAKALESLYIDHESARSRYVAARASEREAALSDELVAERFAVGYVETTELLQSHQALLSARHEVLRAKYMAVLASKMIEFLRTGNVNL